MKRIYILGLVSLSLATIALIAVVAYFQFDRTEVRDIVIAAGPQNADSFVLLTALKQVVERHNPTLKITVHETSGTSDSLQRLERGEAQFAAAQADIPSGNSARAVAVLFDDNLQIFARSSAPIEKFADLKGKKIALPKSGGQYQSFLFIAGHYGMGESDFTFVGQNDDNADLAFSRDEADAVFRVRALHNASISKLVRGGNVKFIPIDQAEALHFINPAIKQAIIPKGNYLGNPPIPAADLVTGSIERTLLASQKVPNDVVYGVTQALMERRPELAAAITDANSAVRPLLASIRQPTERTGVQAALHPGAIEFYSHGRLAVVEKHPDLIVAVLAAVALGGLWLVQIRRMTDRNRRSLADQYNKKAMTLLSQSEHAVTHRTLDPIRTELDSVWTSAIRDLGEEKISDEEFRTFVIIWEAASDTVRRREALFTPFRPVLSQPDESSPTAPEPPPTVEETSVEPRWRLAKLLKPKASS